MTLHISALEVFLTLCATVSKFTFYLLANLLHV